VYGRGQRVRWVRWASTVAEPTFVTGALWLVWLDPGAAWAATVAVSSLYVVVLAVSACRMRPMLCVLSAAVAAVEYLAWAHGAMAGTIGHGSLAVVQPIGAWGAWGRSAGWALAGGVLALATWRMRSAVLSGGTERWRRRRLEIEFGRYVSKDVVHAIMRGDAGVDRAERRELTVLFCDLRDFTGLCEHEDPADVIELLNVFYDAACAAVHARGGTVNKFLGDGLLALFGAPDEHPNHAPAAAAAAHEILDAVDRLRARGGVWRHLNVGIGLDTGHVVCGAVGGASRLEYTAIGTTVNRAARLQGLTRRANRRIVMSDSCVEQLGRRARVESLGAVRLKGFADPVPVYAFRHT